MLNPNKYAALVEENERLSKDLHALLNEQSYEDLVSSNINCRSEINEKSMRLIMRIISESFGAHPHYEDSYPKILKHLQDTYFLENTL